MNEVLFLAIMFVFGAVFGSFACCQAWRLKIKEEGKKNPGKRSVCFSCGRKLKVSENVPIFSWLFLRGRCRKCGAKIGKAEILSEIGLAIIFVLVGMYYFTPIFGAAEVPIMVILKMIMVILSIICMWVIVIYDAKWGRMPNLALLFANIFAAGYLILSIILGEVNLVNLLGAIGLLPGLYYILYVFSKEKLVGGGDWLLGLSIALVLQNWFLALIVLFSANFLASVFSIPMMLKEGKKAQVAFGPFLFIGFLIAFLLQEVLLKLLII